jgi:SAM-dependent methyltransferase
MVVWLAISSYRNDAEVSAILEEATALAPDLFAHILVVDSEGTGQMARLIKERGWDGVTYHSHVDNLGSGGNLAERLRLANEGGADYVYALNHDGALDPAVVRSLLAVAERMPTLGAAYPLAYFTDVAKYNLTGTRELPLSAKFVATPPDGPVLDVHWGSSNGALYSLAPERQGIVPWPTMFMGWEDMEFGWRLADHGYRQVLVSGAVFRDNFEYADTPVGAIVRKPVWRSYYHIRNLILAVRRSRPRPMFYGAAAWRCVLECGLIVFVRPDKWQRLRLLAAGVRDGLAAPTHAAVLAAGRDRGAYKEGQTPFIREPRQVLAGPAGPLPSFVSNDDRNLDRATVEGFGREWERFGLFTDQDVADGGLEYFSELLPDRSLEGARVLDVGCGSGRWTRYFAARAGFVEAADPSRAALVAQQATAGAPNVRVIQASIESLPFGPQSFDLVASVGVVHHMPDPGAAIASLAMLVRPGGRLFLYLYYSLEDRTLPYRAAGSAADLLRRVISRLPGWLKVPACEVAAVFVYLPFIVTARLIRAAAPNGHTYEAIPLHYYVDKSWKIIRNDALDRLGTPIEHRFSRAQVEQMLASAGLTAVRFSEKMPRWRVVAERPVTPA